MKKCPYCFTELDDRASVCSGCRKRVFKKGYDGIAKKQSGCFASAILIIAIMTILMIFGSLFLKSPEQPVQTDGLAYKKSVKDSLRKLKAKHKDAIRKEDLVIDLSTKDTFNIQKQLKGLGYNIGIIDGKLGENTEKAIKQFQRNKQLPASGNINRETKEKLEFAWKKKICDHTTIADDISGLTGRSLDEGRALVIKHFNITEDQFEQINVEGLKKRWGSPEESERNKPEYKYLYGKHHQYLYRKPIEKHFNLDRYSCYELGFRFGRCAGRALKGLECEPNTDFVIPERCRHKDETDKGMKAGLASVF